MMGMGLSVSEFCRYAVVDARPIRASLMIKHAQLFSLKCSVFVYEKQAYYRHHSLPAMGGYRYTLQQT